MKLGIEKIKNVFFFGGVEKEEYEYIKKDFTRLNGLNLQGLSTITAGYMIIMLVSSLQNKILAANRIYFILCLCSCLGVLGASFLGLLKTKGATLIGIYWYLATIFIYGIAIGSTQVSQTTVSFLIFIMVGPLIFFERPANMNCFVAIFDIIFLIITMKVKMPAARETDIINGISYGVISCFLNTATMGLKMRLVLLEKKMHTMAEIDGLTNLKNRYSYEQHYQDYMKQAKKSVTCINIDVNGLHELNNMKGHKAGDEMLKYLAKQIVNLFGKDNAYRVGGDEYIVFCCDEDVDIIHKKIDELTNAMENKQYSISTGIKCALLDDLDMEELIKNADEEMYLAKKKYYENRGLAWRKLRE